MMYRVIIIDDNQNTVRSLQTGVEWEKYGLELAGVAFDGLQGCRLIEQTHPDVVLTDIRMPGIDGFGLIEEEQELLSSARVIVITAYDKFQYAAQAIRLSVFDFILKPIDDEELAASLERVRKSLDEERHPDASRIRKRDIARRTQLIGQLTMLPGVRDEDAEPRFCSPDLDSYCFLAIGTPSEGISQPILQRIYFEWYPPNLDVLSLMLGNELILFCGFREAEEDWKNTVSNLVRRLKKHIPDLRCAVSCLRTDLTKFRESCREAQQALLSHEVTSGRTGVFFCQDQEELSRQPHIADIQVVSQKLTDAEQNPEKIWQLLLESAGGKMRYLRILLMMYSTKMVQKHFANARMADTVDAAVYDIPQIETLESARDWFFRFYGELESAEKNASGISVLVRNVLGYVDAHAVDGVSLESVARCFHVSPNYLSALVRKETGKTYQQHVIEAKMRVAKQLLDDTRMHIEEISRAVGYENYISFYNMFRRMEGCTPSAYRMRNRSGTGEKK